VTRLDPSGYASYYNNDGLVLGTDGNDETIDDVYFTTKEEYDNAKSNANWALIQRNKKTNEEGTKKVVEISGKVNSLTNKSEYGFTQEKDGTTTEIQIGPPTDTYEADIQLTITSNSELTIHAHKKPKSNVQPEPIIGPSTTDKTKYNFIQTFTGTSCNAINIQPNINSGTTIYFYNSTDNTYKISLENYLKSIPLK
jgi:hypothetical protein